MGLRFTEQICGSCFFVTTTFHNRQKHGQVDGVYSALAASLKFCLDKCQARLPGYVLMPSHLHLLLVIDGNNLGSFMRDFKKFTSQKALKDCGISNTRIWMPRYDRVAIQSEKMLREKLNYIHNNPVKAGLVEIAEKWTWSSAGSYVSDSLGPLPVWKGWLF